MYWVDVMWMCDEAGSSGQSPKSKPNRTKPNISGRSMSLWAPSIQYMSLLAIPSLYVNQAARGRGEIFLFRNLEIRFRKSVPSSSGLEWFGMKMPCIQNFTQTSITITSLMSLYETQQSSGWHKVKYWMTSRVVDEIQPSCGWDQAEYWMKSSRWKHWWDLAE